MEHSLVGLIFRPGKVIKFIISDQEEEKERFDFECSTEIDQVKKLENDKDDED